MTEFSAFLNTHGTGGLTFPLPYTLLVSVTANDSSRDFMSATASVLLRAFGVRGATPGGSAEPGNFLTLTQTGPLVDGLLTRSGVLTDSINVDRSVFLILDVRTDAVAGVPESPTLLFLVCCVPGLFALVRRSRSGVRSFR